jgi:2-methylcitrate dehydratase
MARYNHISDISASFSRNAALLNRGSSMKRPTPLAAQFAAFAHDLAARDLPADELRALTRLLADTLACGIAAREVSAMRWLAERATQHRQPGLPEATLLTGGNTTSLTQAARANTAAVRALDANDLYCGPSGSDAGHFSDAIPALLAAAEAHGASGAELIAAIAAAYELQALLCDGAQWTTHGWHTASLLAWALPSPLARLLGHDGQEGATATSIAGITGQALQAWLRPGKPVTAMKTLAPGLVAERAVEAVELAAAGFTAPANALETMLRQLGAEPEALPTERLGAQWTLRRNLIKRFPAQFLTQGAVQAALEVAAQGVHPAEIAAITIYGHRGVCGSVQGSPQAYQPESHEDADHSTPFVVALTLTRGHLTPRDYAGAPWHDAGIRDLMGRIRLVEESERERERVEQGIIGCRLETQLRDGHTLSAEVRQPQGHPDAPLDDATLIAKLDELLDGRLGVGGGARLLTVCDALPGAPDARGIVALLREGTVEAGD